MTRLVRGEGRFALTMDIRSMGRDLNVGLYGGDTPHIGAVALAVPFPSPWKPGRIETSVSLLTVTGHKEGELAANIAAKLAATCDGVVSVACGIHLDEASKADIQCVLDLADVLLAEAMTRYSGKRGAAVRVQE